MKRIATFSVFALAIGQVIVPGGAAAQFLPQFDVSRRFCPELPSTIRISLF
jgi:hypothetical protein